MSQQIQVVEVSAPVGKFDKNGKPFQQIMVQYSDQQGIGKTNLTSYSKAFKPLAAANPGDIFDITTEVNGKYTNLINATFVGKAEPTAVKAAAVAAKSTYETADERARKQVYIVRQSSLANAIAFVNGLQPRERDPATAADVIALAKEFEAYVFGDEVTSTETPRVE